VNLVVLCMSDKTLTAKEIRGDVAEIAQKLEQIESGGHVVLVYPNLETLREIYSHYCRTALENNELVLLLTYYETADSVRHTLTMVGIDVKRYEKERALMIIEDITKTYFGSGQDFLFFLNILNKQQEKRGKNGISVIADMGIFYHFNNNDKDALFRFERSLPAKFDIRLKRFCYYHVRDFDRLEEKEKQDLLEHHYLRVIAAPHPMID
jgi:MEDS: MEthanogen/methylotroph, DcmR Sensory domain